MTDEHRELREALGAYVIGSLRPDERRHVDRHLETCTACRDEVARLTSLPQLLGRLSPDEATGDLLTPSTDLLPNLLHEAGRVRRRDRRRLGAWRAAAVAAAAAAVLAFVAPWEPEPPQAERFVPLPVAADAAQVTGTAAAIAWEWGTTVELELERLPERDAYVLWAIAEDGRREQAGTWGPTEGRRVRMRGASAIQRPNLERIEITDDGGQLLVTFDA